jgi:hypothetical protein
MGADNWRILNTRAVFVVFQVHGHCFYRNFGRVEALGERDQPGVEVIKLYFFSVTGATVERARVLSLDNSVIN